MAKMAIAQHTVFKQLEQKNFVQVSKKRCER